MRGQFDFSRSAHEAARRMENFQRKMPERIPELEAPHDIFIEEHSEDVLLSWRAPEFEPLERDRKWYFLVSVFLAAIVAYALYANSLIMAVTFILIGVVGYMYINKEPRILNFMITPEGVVAGQEIYEFENLKSFWIFYEPHGVEILSLHTDSLLVPYAHIPFTGEDPVRIREILIEFIPEEKHHPGLAENFDRLLRL